jgi:DNA-binding transcriptional LysR family regulator
MGEFAMHLKPRQVEAFRRVMMTGGITAAADAMNITQPAVSRLIRDLEQATALTLFERQGARLVPTLEATHWYREVERLYLGLDQLARAADDIRRHKNVVLRIASVTSLVRPYLHRAILDIVGSRFDLPLVIDVENSRHIWEMVEQHRYDLGFAFGAPHMSEKTALPLHTSQAVAAVAPGHRLASREVITPAELGGERVLMPGRNSPLRLALERAFANQDHAPASTMETSMLNCCCFAASNIGVGIVDRSSIVASGADLVAIPFRPGIEVSYFAVRPSGAARMPVLEHLISRMRELLAS